MLSVTAAVAESRSLRCNGQKIIYNITFSPLFGHPTGHFIVFYQPWRALSPLSVESSSADVRSGDLNFDAEGRRCVKRLHLERKTEMCKMNRISSVAGE